MVCQSRKPPNYNETVLSNTANAAVSSSLFPLAYPQEAGAGAQIPPSVAGVDPFYSIQSLCQVPIVSAGPGGGLGAFPAPLFALELNNLAPRHPPIHLFNPAPDRSLMD